MFSRQTDFKSNSYICFEFTLTRNTFMTDLFLWMIPLIYLSIASDIFISVSVYLFFFLSRSLLLCVHFCVEFYFSIYRYLFVYWCLFFFFALIFDFWNSCHETRNRKRMAQFTYWFHQTDTFQRTALAALNHQ